MDFNDYMKLWNYAHCKVMDVRRISMKAGECISAYVVPSSLFLMSIRGSGSVMLDGAAHPIRRYTVLHTGKGVRLDIQAGRGGLDYYSVYYKAGIPASGQNLAELSRRARPFDYSYSFVPESPAALHRFLSDMFKSFGTPQALSPLHARALLSQFVHELLIQMHMQSKGVEKRGLAAQVVSIIHDRYAEPITLEALSESLNYSVPHLSSYFKNRTGLSPIDYLIKVRIDKAAALLLETDATLKEIASGVGYQDPYYLGRLFKKYKGVSPSRYREEHAARRREEDCPATTMRSSIVPPDSLVYTDISDNHYQYKMSDDREEDLFMLKPSGTLLATVLLLSCMLVISACGANNTAGTESAQSTAAPSPSDLPQTKTVSTINGDIEIPADPERIVAGEYLGSLIALGITPVGTSDHHLKNPYFQEYLKDVENIGEGNGNLEKIMALDPDLIIMDDTYAELNEQLSKIAPTVVIPFASLKTVHEEVSYFGELLGKDNEAASWLADYDSRMAAAKENVLKTIPADRTFSILEVSDADKSIMAVGADFGKGGQPIYNGFGFKPPSEVAAEMADPGWASISAETLPKYAGDYIILTSDSYTLDKLKAEPVWSSLDAVKNGRVYIWGTDRSWYWDPIAILSQTEELAAWLAGL
ncbi:AraC family transcriptional regulator [Paenibacillus sp. S150]|uniref:AraC family transcriptional regulator n=1 Tax=Paenibacillus sp. S150 TaxID=2749826 RepID=UPI001C571103|nr:AraC family transcriptional regulator [Paenibacillus sp. S150]MBW4083701.1 AraC family transcriptional regulator [Paenibacillus sp. S150]